MQSLPTNQHNQDVVPFGTQAALTALDQAERLRWVHGTLAVALRQALHLGGRSPRSDFGRVLAERLCEAIQPIEHDRPLDRDVRHAADILDAVASDELDVYSAVSASRPQDYMPRMWNRTDLRRERHGH